MNRNSSVAGLVLALALALSQHPGVAAEKGPCGDNLARLSSVYRSAKTLKARFVHSLEAPALNQSEREEGILTLARGGKMRWDYSVPQGKLAWADGKKSYLYLPEDRQVLVQPLEGSLPVRLLMGTADLDKECRCKGAVRLAGETDLSLEMVDATVGIRDLTVKVEDRRGVVTFLAYKDPLGNQIALTFSDIEVDAPVPDSAFKIPIPKGARVIENP
jgi:outer membrane lipoprotein-sorting protein